AERAKGAVDVPIAFGPRYGDPVRADQALGEGTFDFWEVCRPFLADPELLHKTAENRVKEIRPCIGGLMCLSRMFRNLPYVCAVNPRLGHEYDPAYTVEPAPASKRVLVIGGGPGGMECALTAARRGHEVTLVEKSGSLGGQMRIAALEIEEGGKAFRDLILSYQRQMEAAGVHVEVRMQVTPEFVRRRKPDVAVVATGATFERPAVPGADLPHVLFGDWTLPEQIPGAQRVVVLSAERAGLVLAEHLAEAGHEVVVVGDGKVASDVIPTFKWRHASWIEEHGLRILRDTHVESINDKGVHVRCGEEERLLPCDCVVVAGPRRSVNHLLRELEFSVDELHVLGDAVLPRAVANAVHEGFRVGNAI
ncbi:MAG: FAD-dependent oxidoreductase, partial [Planctomycetota bacterium]